MPLMRRHFTPQEVEKHVVRKIMRVGSVGEAPAARALPLGWMGAAGRSAH